MPITTSNPKFQPGRVLDPRKIFFFFPIHYYLCKNRCCKRELQSSQSKRMFRHSQWLTIFWTAGREGKILNILLKETQYLLNNLNLSDHFNRKCDCNNKFEFHQLYSRHLLLPRLLLLLFRGGAHPLGLRQSALSYRYQVNSWSKESLCLKTFVCKYGKDWQSNL